MGASEIPSMPADDVHALSSNKSARVPAPLKPSGDRRVSLPLASPSSPDLPLNERAQRVPALSMTRTVSRSSSVPRDAGLPPSRRRNSQLDNLFVDAESVDLIRRWILAIVQVEFDLDQGPVLNGCFPSLSLSNVEAENIAFCSFPDSLQFDQGSQAHSFRVRDQGHLLRPTSKDGFLYGFAFFTQRKDASSKRGYLQRSLVFITHDSYPGLFSRLSTLLGPLYDTHGIPMLESACQNIAKWPDPAPEALLELGFLGSVLNVQLPPAVDDQQLTEPTHKGTSDPRVNLVASSAPLLPPPLDLFEASLSHLWSIWECLVLCEPVLIYGPSPAATSQAVWWLRDLLRPIPTAYDHRPYFTIHDQDHAQLVNKLPPKSAVLLGVTNPFLVKSCAHWPHVLSLGQETRAATAQKNKVDAGGGPPPGWRTRTHNRYISKDRQLLKRLEDACKGSEQDKLDASLLLRRHFCARSTALLVPLSRYLNTLIPTPAESSPLLCISGSKSSSSTTSASSNSTNGTRLKPFNSAHFFASLKAHGASLPFRSPRKQKEFYERWVKSPAFGAWLARQEEVVEKVLRDNRERTIGKALSPQVG